MKSKSVKNHINSKSGFSDPAKVKVRDQVQECQPEDGVNSPWDFRCPQYDQRSSNFINAGTHYGVGINQPVGHMGDAKQTIAALPMGRVNTMRVDEVG